VPRARSREGVDELAPRPIIDPGEVSMRNITRGALLGVAALALAVGFGCSTEPLRSVSDSRFVGSETCGACHQNEYKSWQASYHAKMVRPKDVAILKDVVAEWAKGGPTKVNLTGKPATLADVVYVVGSNWKQRFLVKNPETGGHLFLDKQWNRMTKKWENYGQANDWDTNCATCHATGYRLTSYDEKNPKAQKWALSEMNIGCESCHGAGSAHTASRSKKDIYTFADKPKAEQTRVCGYCHIRLENEHFKTAQGNPSEHMPHPVVGRSWHPSEDWTKWYPEGMVVPGVQAEDKIDATYKGDLAGMFKLDDQSKSTGIYDAGKHHQQYQEYLQSKHYKGNLASCSDCHSSHAGAKPMIVAKDTCKGCHDASYTVEKYMPGTGQTAAGLFIKTHTFNKAQARPPALTASGDPVYQNPMTK
jgi:nitrate/TMAO reductase-like tetraheme cytochrome c subunit